MTATRIRSGDLSDEPGAQRTAEAPADRTIRSIWLPPIFNNGDPYFVRIEVYAGIEPCWQ